jgi:fatty-acyl-CoA synthase
MAEVVTDALRWWVRALPERVAIDVGGEEVRYRQLGQWTDRVARSLANEHGVRPGDVVAIVGTNSLEWCIAALGAMKSGAIVTPINFRYTVSEVEFLVRDCAPRVILSDGGEAPKLRQVAERGYSFEIVPFTAVRALQDGNDVAFRVDVSPSDPAVLAYTSGTTGHPKGLTYTHATILASMLELLLKDPTPPEETTMLLALPLCSVAGIIHALVHMSARGAKVVVMEDFEPHLALRLLAEHRISHLNGVPVIYERIAAVPDFEDYDLSCIKVAMTGGARVSDALLAAFHRRGVALRHMYGMTEAGGCGSVPRPDDALAHPELCGDGSVFTDVKTVRPDGTQCDPGEPGEIVMRGPAMMVGYWNNTKATEQAITDGWLHSGDLGVIDENGYLRFVDRLKDLIISGGFNISPSEVEAVIGAVPGVTEVAVIAVPDEHWGETPAAIIYSQTGEIDDQRILQAARQELAVFKVPRYVVHADGPLPRMASGKLAKRELREHYADVPKKCAPAAIGSN